MRKTYAKEIHYGRNSTEVFPVVMMTNFKSLLAVLRRVSVGFRHPADQPACVPTRVRSSDVVPPRETYRSQAPLEMYKSQSKHCVFCHLTYTLFGDIQWQCFPSSSSAPFLQPLLLPTPSTLRTTLWTNAWMSKAACLLMERLSKCTYPLNLECTSLLSTPNFQLRLQRDSSSTMEY